MSSKESQVLKQFLGNLSEELDKFINDLSLTTLAAARDIILEAEDQGGRVHITGIGKPGHVADYVASLLSSTGTPAYFLDATETIHGSAGQVRPGDVVISISNSGETEELKRTVMTLKQNGAKIISVTGDKESWLSKKSDCTLLASVNHEGDRLNKPPRASIIVEVTVLQALSVLLQEAKGLTASEYVKWHPGGTLGQAVLAEQIEGRD
ncbi:SIS domain-containing protein [Carnobacterium maltaromaticum]|uniref:SIS domain-containing protein n=1 Tax=Carnobacterium maltaromaticum TaxID=2751 RepID=UPI0007048C0A|nr:SIS domain-containing protein [Carnobacterium maltaromaticum]KRN87938.1 sugar isomerase (SIS) [Carnobacterium maltaromaticum]MDT1944109.1 SIS domain-containing protein [Carnobacterium maltaromaticum]MDT1998169.1 SIS domain-containing protein [Carnobacterium maltaromaticum]TFJ26851.1 SIS domain-containing protein [Carnobacterium maltaromaticum]TFJ30923.1 SIS domain-containing protein [Carnobacterium maltaromaticum]